MRGSGTTRTDWRGSPSAVEDALRGKRVLIVDDDAGVLDSLCEMVARHGMDALAASDVPEAVAALVSGTFEPDVMLVDYVLPRGDAAEVISAGVRLRHTPAIVLITAQRELMPQLAARLRVDSALTKPVRSGAVLRAIARALIVVELRTASIDDDSELEIKPLGAVDGLSSRVLEGLVAAVGCRAPSTVDLIRLRERIAGRTNKEIAYAEGISADRVRASVDAGLRRIGAKEPFGLLRTIADRIAEALVREASGELSVAEVWSEQIAAALEPSRTANVRGKSRGPTAAARQS